MKKVSTAYVTITILAQSAIALHAGVYVWFLQYHGLTPFQFNLVNVVFWGASFLLEVPTGHIADRYGRRISTLVGYAAAALGFTVYGCSSSFWGFITAELIVAVGFACVSGSLEAWGYEAARLAGEDVDAMLRQAERTKHIAKIAAVALGGYLSLLWAPLALLAGGFVYMITFVVAYRTITGSAAGKVSEKEIPTIREIRKLHTENIPLWQICWAALYFACICAIPNMLWQPTLANLGFIGPDTSGVILSVGFLLAFTASFATRRASLRLFYVGLGILGMMMILLPINGITALYLFLGTQIPRAVMNPMTSILANRNMGDCPRATGLSVIAAFARIGGLVGLICSGIIAEFSIIIAWIVFGLFAVVLAIIALQKLK